MKGKADPILANADIYTMLSKKDIKDIERSNVYKERFYCIRGIGARRLGTVLL